MGQEVEFSELKGNRIPADVVIIPCFGGWGNVPLQQAQDLKPIIEGIQAYLDSNGIKPIVSPHRRAPAHFPSPPSLNIQLAMITEMLGIHKTRARRFAADLETLCAKNPQVKWLLIGLSNGADFVDKTMELISPTTSARVFAIEIAVPFWRGVCNYENILRFDNNGKDPLPNGELEEVFFAALKAGINFLSSAVNGEWRGWERAWHIPAHDYHWENIGPAVRAFLQKHLVLNFQTGYH